VSAAGKIMLLAATGWQCWLESHSVSSAAGKIMLLAATAAMHPKDSWPFPIFHTKQATGILLPRHSNQRKRRRNHRRTRPHGWKGGAK
jgi:hypothetical protein